MPVISHPTRHHERRPPEALAHTLAVKDQQSLTE
jgi:hypothetical protein